MEISTETQKANVAGDTEMVALQLVFLIRGGDDDRPQWR